MDLNELDYDRMFQFGAIALVALIVLARLLLR